MSCLDYWTSLDTKCKKLIDCIISVDIPFLNSVRVGKAKPAEVDSTTSASSSESILDQHRFNMLNHSTQSSPQNRLTAMSTKQMHYPAVMKSQAASQFGVSGSLGKTQSYGNPYQLEKSYQASEPMLPSQPNDYKTNTSGAMYPNSSLPTYPKRQPEYASDVSETSTLTSPIPPSSHNANRGYSKETVFGNQGLYSNPSTPKYQNYGYYTGPNQTQQYPQQMASNPYALSAYNMPFYPGPQQHPAAHYHQLAPYSSTMLQANGATSNQYGQLPAAEDFTQFPHEFENIQNGAQDEWNKAPLEKYDPTVKTSSAQQLTNHVPKRATSGNLRSMTSADETSVSEVVEERLYLGENNMGCTDVVNQSHRFRNIASKVKNAQAWIGPHGQHQGQNQVQHQETPSHQTVRQPSGGQLLRQTVVEVPIKETPNSASPSLEQIIKPKANNKQKVSFLGLFPQGERFVLSNVGGDF